MYICRAYICMCIFKHCVYNDNVKVNLNSSNDLGKKREEDLTFNKLVFHENRNNSVRLRFVVHEHPHLEKLSKFTWKVYMLT